MKQMKRITLRLSLENPSDKRIADFLANIDKNKYHTVNNAIKTILFSVINDTDGKSSVTTSKIDMKDIIAVIRNTLETEIPKLINGNAIEKSEKADMKEIISVIRTTLEAGIPKLLSVFGSSNHTKIEQNNTSTEKTADTLDDDDIDMDFIGG